MPTLEAEGFDIETRIAFGTDIAESILDVAKEIDATSIVFVPRGSGILARRLSGDVEHKLTTKSDRPVVALPRRGEGE
ncbi:universal stress protein [Halogeometricum sp. S1BR25-6]|uniref:Universal stress protein n=1 Tax=Halogeometricum salsisoli TaxID=2950536 RepID=A0ABU2GJQ8_9EURY|nr:universal stress protein [Halogeometricum sp. S1BR25-6]MDS0301019.1 universal stress protein [Halogeometricum sp. S1BR25-6]